MAQVEDPSSWADDARDEKKKRRRRKTSSTIGPLKAYYTPMLLHERLCKLANSLEIGISDLHAVSLEAGLHSLEMLELDHLRSELRRRKSAAGPKKALYPWRMI